MLRRKSLPNWLISIPQRFPWAVGRGGRAGQSSSFLASEDSSYINAIELVVDGGATGTPFGGLSFVAKLYKRAPRTNVVSPG